MEEFLSLSECALSACDIVLRKADKKKEKLLSSTQRHSLIEQLNAAQEAALVLHVAVLLLFHSVTQTLLNASGRFVPTIVTFLQSHLPAPTYELLLKLQGTPQTPATSNNGAVIIYLISYFPFTLHIRFGYSRVDRQRRWRATVERACCYGRIDATRPRSGRHFQEIVEQSNTGIDHLIYFNIFSWMFYFQYIFWVMDYELFLRFSIETSNIYIYMLLFGLFE